MTRNRRFYEDVSASVRKYAEDMRLASGEIRDLEEMKKSGKYAAEYILKSIDPKIMTLKQKIEKLKISSENSINEMCEQYRRELLDEDSLKGSELTEDAKLLNSGMKLSKKDLDAMLRRNDGNKTMEQLICRYADENNIDLGIVYTGNNPTLAKLKAIPYVTGVALKWYDQPDLVEKFIGEGSDLDGAFAE